MRLAPLAEHCGKKVEGGRQTIVVSATLTPRVLLHCQPWCPDPVKVFVGVQGQQQQQHPSDTAAPAAPPLPQQGQQPGASSSDGGSGEPEAATAARPQWGWGLPQAPSADGSAFVSISGSAGGFGNADAVPGLPPSLRHVYVTSAPQHKVDTLRCAPHWHLRR